MKWVIFGMLLMTSVARADIVCKAQTSMGPARIDIGPQSVTISGAALDAGVTYPKVDAIWDGHQTELITAPGLAVSYADWYGCIHNARITANFRSETGYIESVDVAQCSGGTTPDEICHVAQ